MHLASRPTHDRQRRLLLARRRLGVANDALRAAHTIALIRGGHPNGPDAVQIAQELVVTLEQEVAILEDAVRRTDAEPVGRPE